MLIIGIAGGSGSGKTSIVKQIIRSIPQERIVVLSQDSYYKDNSHLSQQNLEEINFDHPSAIEWPLLVKHIHELKAGKDVQVPTYSYITCSRGTETVTVSPADVIVVEGILIFTCPELLEELDIKVFVDAEADERLIRIIHRDGKVRGRNLEESIRHYHKFVKPMHEAFIEPSKKLAHIIIPEGGHNTIGINVLLSKIQQTLNLQ